MSKHTKRYARQAIQQDREDLMRQKKEFSGRPHLWVVRWVSYEYSDVLCVVRTAEEAGRIVRKLEKQYARGENPSYVACAVASNL